MEVDAQLADVQQCQERKIKRYCEDSYTDRKFGCICIMIKFRNTNMRIKMESLTILVTGKNFCQKDIRVVGEGSPLVNEARV